MRVLQSTQLKITLKVSCSTLAETFIHPFIGKRHDEEPRCLGHHNRAAWLSPVWPSSALHYAHFYTGRPRNGDVARPHENLWWPWRRSSPVLADVGRHRWCIAVRGPASVLLALTKQPISLLFHREFRDRPAPGEGLFPKNLPQKYTNMAGNMFPQGSVFVVGTVRAF